MSRLETNRTGIDIEIGLAELFGKSVQYLITVQNIIFNCYFILKERLYIASFTNLIFKPLSLDYETLYLPSITQINFQGLLVRNEQEHIRIWGIHDFAHLKYTTNRFVHSS